MLVSFRIGATAEDWLQQEVIGKAKGRAGCKEWRNGGATPA